MLKGFREFIFKGDLISHGGRPLHHALIVFVATAAAVYFFVVVPYKRSQDMRGVSAKTPSCPECTTAISVAAKRCPSCTATVLPDSV